MLPVTVVGVRAVGLVAWQALLGRLAGGARATGDVASPANAAAARASARMVRVASERGIARGTCLTRSLTLWWMLRRRGIDAELRIGVRKGQGSMDAHAWIEVRGTVVGDAPSVRERYSVFDHNFS